MGFLSFVVKQHWMLVLPLVWAQFGVSYTLRQMDAKTDFRQFLDIRSSPGEIITFYEITTTMLLFASSFLFLVKILNSIFGVQRKTSAIVRYHFFSMFVAVCFQFLGLNDNLTARISSLTGIPASLFTDFRFYVDSYLVIISSILVIVKFFIVVESPGKSKATANGKQPAEPQKAEKGQQNGKKQTPTEKANPPKQQEQPKKQPEQQPKKQPEQQPKKQQEQPKEQPKKQPEQQPKKQPEQQKQPAPEQPKKNKSNGKK